VLAKTETVAFIGTEARLVEVEVDVSTGLPAFRLVGLPAKSIQEAEQRVRAALLSSEERWPPARITANLAPGDLRKEGTHLDLAIALGIVAADRRLDPECLEDWLFIGELALNGSVRGVRGALAAAIACRQLGKKGLVCPAANAAEAAVIEGTTIIPVSTFKDCVGFLKGSWEPPLIDDLPVSSAPEVPDISEVRGQSTAKSALEIAAAGGHNLMLVGSPGSGKTMLAQRLPGILPEMSLEESIDVTKIYSVAGLLPECAALISQRPLRAPHQHISAAGLVGGGANLARPGEVSLAHNGVLFLDEIALFRSDVLESLRGPVEDGSVRIARAAGVVTYPSRFSLIAAMNPCMCGYLNDARRPCSCTGLQLHHYSNRLSGPLLDRFDMEVRMTAPTKDELLGEPLGETSDTVRERVSRARAIQRERYSSDATNASCSKRQLNLGIRLDEPSRALLGDAVEGMMLSGRGLVRTLRVARTIADLSGHEVVTEEHIAKALNFRRRNPEVEVAA
jgi:magnesium chelatase family protein